MQSSPLLTSYSGELAVFATWGDGSEVTNTHSMYLYLNDVALVRPGQVLTITDRESMKTENVPFADFLAQASGC